MTDLFTGASSELWCRKGERIPRFARNAKSVGGVKVPVGMTDLFTGASSELWCRKGDGFLALLGMTRVLVASRFGRDDGLFTGATSELWRRKGERIPRFARNDKSVGGVKVRSG